MPHKHGDSYMPVLSGFLPIPLAMMIPFMGAQSLVLGKQFGEGFQYGKRKISAMSNEEFNKLTPAKLAQDNAEELKQMIPSMQASITDMRSFQSFIVRELIATVQQLPDDIFGKGAPFSIEKATETAVDEKFGLQGIYDAIKKASVASLVQYQPKTYHSNQPETVVPIPTVPSGQIGPQQTGTLITQDRVLYQSTVSAMSDKILDFTFTTELRGPKNQMKLSVLYAELNKRKKSNPNLSINTQTRIDQTATGLSNQIATAYYLVTRLLLSTEALKGKSGTAYNKRSMIALDAMKTYNRLVTSNRKPNLQIDTRKSLLAGKPVKK